MDIYSDGTKNIYIDGELEKIYNFSNLQLDLVEKYDHISDSVIVNHWLPTALDTPSYYYRIAKYYDTRGRHEKSIKFTRFVDNSSISLKYKL